MNKNSRIYVAGHRGLVGSALTRRLEAQAYENILCRTHAEIDLESPQAVDAFFASERPEFVFLAAAKVGGIHANNSFPVDFLLRNLKIQNNVVEASWRYGVKGLLFLGSSCIYPKMALQPIREECLLSGLLEPTNEPYAIAKIAGIELSAAYNRQYGTRYLCVMPTNLYGPNDTYDLESSHVLPALIRKFHLGKLASVGDWESIAWDEARFGRIPEDFSANLAEMSKANGYPAPQNLSRSGDANPAVRLWGTGSPQREFLYSDDLADACLLLMERIDEAFEVASSCQPSSASAASRFLFNIGCGEDVTIRDLSETVARMVGYSGPVEWDATKPDGTPRKLLDIGRIKAFGWSPRVPLDEGIRLAYKDYLERLDLVG